MTKVSAGERLLERSDGALLREDDVEALVQGCGVLGAGGGGPATLAHAVTSLAVRESGPVAVVDLVSLPEDALVLPVSFVGAPEVLSERVLSGTEAPMVRARVETELGKEIAAVMIAQIGGGIGAFGAMWAAELDLPLVDADGVGGTASDVSQTTMNLHGVPGAPMVLAGPRGDVVQITATGNQELARIAMGAAATLGGSCVAGMYPMPAGIARDASVRGSVSRALAIGRALAGGADDPVTATLSACGGRRLLRGRVVDLERRDVGVPRASVVIEGLADDAGQMLRLELQSEIHLAQVDGEVVACTPDIITVLSSTTGKAIPREQIRRGHLVSVIGIPCDPMWRTARGLALRGPRAFGYDVAYTPLDAAVMPR